MNKRGKKNRVKQKIIQERLIILIHSKSFFRQIYTGNRLGRYMVQLKTVIEILQLLTTLVSTYLVSHTSNKQLFFADTIPDGQYSIYIVMVCFPGGIILAQLGFA